MSTRRFLCPDLAEDRADVELPADEAAHAARVIRLRVGDDVVLLDGVGTVADCQVVDVGIGRRTCTVACHVLRRKHVPPPARRVHLYVAPPRARVMDLIVRHATELGVWEIVPTLCENSVSRPHGEGFRRSLLTEAAVAIKQSGNPYLPGIRSPVPFDEALATAPAEGYVGDAAGVGSRRNVTAPRGDLAVWVGPEGGFTPEERAALDAAGYAAITVGNWILRVETAVPALLGWLAGTCDDDPSTAPAR